MGILSWIVLGLVAGALARLIMPGSQKMGLLATMLLGILGAFLGGFIGAQFGLGSVSGFNVTSLLVALGGSVVVLFLYGLLRT